MPGKPTHMIVRRTLGGVLAIGLAAPLLAAAPHDGRESKTWLPAQPPPGLGTRVFARADGGAEPSPSPGSVAAPDGPGPASVPSPEIAARARAVFDANRAGKIDRSHYSAEMNGAITDEALARVSRSLQKLGSVKTFGQVRRITTADRVVYVFRIDFEDATEPAIEEIVAWNEAGKVDFLSFGASR